MEFMDSAGTRYQLTEVADAPTPAKKPIWSWVVGGLAWMASASTRKPNPVTPEIEALIEEARDPLLLRSRLVELVKHSEVEVRRAALDNPNLCPTRADGKLNVSLLENLAKEFPEEVANLPLFVLHTLIEPTDEFEVVVTNVVQRTTDRDLMESLLRHWGTFSEVRLAISQNPRTPANALRILGNPESESDKYVRREVASNPNTPVDVLRPLGNQKTESNKFVRQAVADNPRTPEEILRILGNEQTESKWEVRLAVAKNPSTPVDVLRILVNETTEFDCSVRKAAQKALAERGLA